MSHFFAHGDVVDVTDVVVAGETESIHSLVLFRFRRCTCS